MARRERILSARGAMAISKPGRHSDGGGLYLYLSKDARRSWVYLFAWQGRQCEMGLGAYPQTSLAEARERRDKWRKVLMDGRNPIEVRRDGSRTSSSPTFGACADELLATKSSHWSNAKHRQQWRRTLEGYAAPLYGLPVDQVCIEAVLGVLNPIWQSIPETASRLRGRIEAVLDIAKARGWRSGENPAAWRGNLALILPKRGKLSRGHHAAMPYRDLPEFIGQLREHRSVSLAAMALEFAILTAARSGEALGARWAEFDLEAKVWTIPVARMKSGSEHRVPLSSQAGQIVKDLEAIRTSAFLFPGQRRDSPLAPSALATVLARLKIDATVHGFRSAFRDWVGNETAFTREIAEQALAHATGNAVELSYRRSDALERRRALMEAWASYCEPDSGGKIIPIRTTL
jgi:integrase